MWAGLGAAGIGAGAGLLGGFLQRSQDKKEAKKSRKFTEYMASTAYQRTMADMKLAGLNPILGMATKGAHQLGPSARAAPAPNIGAAAVGGASSAVAMKRMASMMADEAKIKKVEAQYAPMMADQALNIRSQEWQKLRKEIANIGAHTRMTDVTRNLSEANIPSARAMMELDRTTFGKRLRQWHRIVGGAVGSVPMPGVGLLLGRGKAAPRRRR